jgi:uncharacterized lipoprotein
MLTLVLVGCSAHSPQQIRLLPALAVPDSDQRYSAGVIVNASDERRDKVIGSRGGVYSDTAVITLAVGAEEALAETFAEGLRGLGFSTEEVGNTRVAVALRDLVLTLGKDELMSTAEVTAQIRVEATRDMESIKGDYQSRFDHRFLLPASDSDISVFLNQAIGAALDKALQDDTLLDFLQGNS